MKKIFSIVIIVICLSMTTCFAMYKLVIEKNAEIEVDCVEANAFRGNAFEIMDNLKNNTCGINLKSSDSGVEFIGNDNNHIKYNDKIYTFSIIKKEYYMFLLTDGKEKIEIDPDMIITSGDGSNNNPYILSNKV